MAIKWCHNAKTNEIFSYQEAEGLTDFPRGTLMAYGDYLTTGFRDKNEAEAWSTEYGCCDKCKSARKPDENGNCQFCGSTVIFIHG